MGVDYVSAFVGRVEDFGLNNKKLVWDTKQAIIKMNSPAKVIAASMRNPDYLIDAILAGSDVVTVPPSCWEKVYKNPLFDLGEREFLESWKQLPDDVRKSYESIT